MSAPSPAPVEWEDQPLVFRWPGRNVNLAVPVFLVLSLLLHAAGFYLFQVVYPPAVSLAPAPVSLTLIPEGTPDGAVLREWIRANDPALLAVRAGGDSALAAARRETPYRPSYEGRSVRLLTQAGKPAKLPPMVVAGPVLDRVSAGLPPKAEGTAFARFAGADGELFESALPEALEKLPGTTGPARCMVGAGPGGEVRFFFLVAGSGDAGADAWMERALRGWKFPAGEGIIWREIRCDWIFRP